MRACTAVVTEMSYNYEGDDYRAEIEFVSAADWRKELKMLFDDMLDPDGYISKDTGVADSDAGIAFAKVRSVYPRRTKEDFNNLANERGIERLMNEVDSIVGTTKRFTNESAIGFYRELQSYIDSKEKYKDKNGELKNVLTERDWWPLIKVVRLQIRSVALSTGAVIVDLPGVHDANQARAAVAERYMRQCTGSWVVAPIVRHDILLLMNPGRD